MIETEDLFFGAYALTRGGELSQVAVKSVNGRRLAVFTIDGDLGEAVQAYWHGEATVNLQLLKSQLRRLKDHAFTVVREEQEKRDAVFEAGGAGHALASGAHRRHRR